MEAIKKQCSNCFYMRKYKKKMKCSNNIRVAEFIGVDVPTASNLMASGGKVDCDESGTCEYWINR